MVTVPGLDSCQSEQAEEAQPLENPLLGPKPPYMCVHAMSNVVHIASRHN